MLPLQGKERPLIDLTATVSITVLGAHRAPCGLSGESVISSVVLENEKEKENENEGGTRGGG
jgi:hypothetical protein